jgi:hypothetical protein
MMAYASLIEGKCDESSLSNELKRYCELDTLGMVFIAERIYDLMRGN